MTLTEKYHLVLENKMPKAHFSKEALRQFSAFITPNNTFTDIVTILKQKGIISENTNVLPGGKGDKLTDKDVDPKQLAMGINVELEHTKDSKIAKEIALDHLAENPTYYTDLKPLEDKEKKLNEAKKVELDADHVNPYELKKGNEYEMCKTDDPEKARKKVLANLNKDPMYYTRLLTGEKLQKKRTDLPVEVNKKADNVVDKANAAKPISKAKVKSNVKDKTDKLFKTKVKEMTTTPQKIKGVKVMEIPKKKGKTIKLKEHRDIHNSNNLITSSGIKVKVKRLVAECMCEMGLTTETDIYGIAGNPEEEFDKKRSFKKKDSFAKLVKARPNIKFTSTDGKVLLQKIGKELGQDSDIYTQVSELITVFTDNHTKLLTKEGLGAIYDLLYDNDLIDKFKEYLVVPVSVNELQIRAAGAGRQKPKDEELDENSPAPEMAKPQSPKKPTNNKDLEDLEKALKFCIAVRNQLKRQWTGSKFNDTNKVIDGIKDLFSGLNMDKNNWIEPNYVKGLDAYREDIDQDLKNTKDLKSATIYKVYAPENLKDIAGDILSKEQVDSVFNKFKDHLDEDVNLDKQAKDAEKRATDAKIKALQAKKNELNKVNLSEGKNMKKFLDKFHERNKTLKKMLKNNGYIK